MQCIVAMKPALSRILLVAILVAVSVAASEPIPEVSAVRSNSVTLPFTGVRGLHWSGSELWLLVSDYDGLSAPTAAFESRIVAYNPDRGSTRTVSRDRNGFSAGLTFGEEFFWSAGSLIGSGQSVYQIDPATGEIPLTLPSSGYHPGGMAFDGTYLWVSDASARKLIRLEIEEGKVSRKIATPGFYPTGLAYDGAHFWCADASTGRIYRIRRANGRVTGVIDDEVFLRPGEFVSLTWDGRALWAAGADDSLAVRLEILR